MSFGRRVMFKVLCLAGVGLILGLMVLLSMAMGG